MIGTRFGRLIVENEVTEDTRYWLCRCDCGALKEVNKGAISFRLKKGWSVERALSTPMLPPGQRWKERLHETN